MGKDKRKKENKVRENKVRENKTRENKVKEDKTGVTASRLELIEDPKVNELVSNLARHYYKLIRADRRGLITIEDLILAGYEGVLVAAGRYRHDSGAKFTTYSTGWIKGEMIREMIFYVGKDALLIDDIENLPSLTGKDASDNADDSFDISDIPPEEQLKIITSKLAEYNLAKIEVSVYLAVNGIGCDRVTNLKALGRQFNKREMEIRRIWQSAEDKVKRGLMKEKQKREKKRDEERK